MDRVLAILIGWPVCFLILVYRRKVKEFIGEVGFAERVLGVGGTNTFIILVSILLFIGCLMYAMGTLQGFLQKTLGILF